MSRRRLGSWAPYVPVAERRARAAAKAQRKLPSGQKALPVEISGRKIATTFWGEAWCTNLEAYSDFANRLPRGRTLARNGSVVHLEIREGRVKAMVAGGSTYDVTVKIRRLQKKPWKDIKARCANGIGSLVELLSGSISESIMEIVTAKGEGLFPAPHEIELNCSCPDWAVMCKHVAGTLYGVAARLDNAPELLFTLRGVDPNEMVEAAVVGPATQARSGKRKVLDASDLTSVFGVTIDREDEVTKITESASIAKRRKKKTTPKKNRNSASATKTVGKKKGASKKRLSGR